MKSFKLMLGAAVAVTGLAIASANAAPAGVKVGTLTCNVAGGMGFVFGSSKDLACSYEPTKAVVEHYTGSISKWGVDIGYTGKGKLIWAVFAPTSDVRSGAIEGEYAGASAQANVGVGLALPDTNYWISLSRNSMAGDAKIEAMATPRLAKPSSRSRA